MRIAQISTPYEATPPEKYGGTERVVSLLTEELCRRGQEVTLFATGNSHTDARLHAFFARPARPYEVLWESIHAMEVIKSANDFDIIHNHNEAAIAFLPFTRRPRVTTIHNPISAAVALYLEYFKDENYVTVSTYHSSKIANLPHVHVVYNSIRPDDFPFSSQKEDFLLFVGYFTPYKGVDLAIEVARRLQKKLVIVAKLDSEGQHYYETKVAPFIDQEEICYVGELGEERKDFFRRAQCLLCPIRDDEPFGLVMIEAMACGTPVVALANASAPEIVRHGVTGFTARTVEEMVQAVHQLDRIDPARCREHVVNCFSVDVMVDRYLDVYQKITG
jgi:glycosyltransferase involved in cell wall biosynthesis